MLLDFLRENRDELIARTRVRVAARPVPRANAVEMEKGIPIFLTQLTEIFRLETLGLREEPGALAKTAAMHGAELLKNGYTVAQAINDYGDICQVVTELAAEMQAPITVVEYNTFNRCLDDAMANAVSEYLRGREQMISEEEVERLGTLAHEQRNLLSAAMLAFQVLRSGSVGMDGSTSAVLGRSLIALRDLTDRSLAEVRFAAGLHHSERIELAAFIEQIEAAATMEARVKGLQVTVLPPRYGTAVEADRQLLGSALGNLISNAFKFSRPGGHVVLRTIVRGGRLAIEVEDECCGLPPAKAEELFRPFDQRGHDRTGLGLGLTIARRAVTASGGTIRVTNLPGRGCVFTIELPVAPAGDERSAPIH
jgi:signal transduction histidine kinase